MKLQEVKLKNQFCQKTFYGWLRREGLIKKGELGYEVGEQVAH